MDLNAKIFIAGHRGPVGSAILRNRFPFFEAERPECVFPTTSALLADFVCTEVK